MKKVLWDTKCAEGAIRLQKCAEGAMRLQKCAEGAMRYKNVQKVI